MLSPVPAEAVLSSPLAVAVLLSPTTAIAKLSSLDHLAAVVVLSDDPISVELLVCPHGSLRPAVG